MNKLLSLFLVSALIAVTYAQIPTKLALVGFAYEEPDRNNHFQIINIQNGDVLLNNSWIDTPLNSNVLGITDITSTSCKIYTTNTTYSSGSESTSYTYYATLYNYTYSTNEVESIGWLETTDSFEFNYQPSYYDSSSQMLYIPGVFNSPQINNLTLLQFDFFNHEFGAIDIDVDFVSLPVGGYDTNTGIYYIGFYQDNITPTIVSYDLTNNTILKQCVDLSIADTFVYIFVSNGQPFVLMYGVEATYILLYSIDMATCESKLVYKIETYYQKNNSYFVNNNDYIVFFTVPSGLPTSTQVTIVDLTTFATIFQSSSLSLDLSLSYVMTLLD